MNKKLFTSKALIELLLGASFYSSIKRMTIYVDDKFLVSFNPQEALLFNTERLLAKYEGKAAYFKFIGEYADEITASIGIEDPDDRYIENTIRVDDIKEFFNSWNCSIYDTTTHIDYFNQIAISSLLIGKDKLEIIV